MFHLEMFSSSIATGAGNFQQLSYVFADAILPRLVNGMQVSPDIPYLLAVAGVGVNLGHIRVQANSMLPFPYPALSPNNRGTGFESPTRLWDFSYAPLPLKPTEEFDIFATQNAAGAQVEYVACLFSDGKPTPIHGTLNPHQITLNPATAGRVFTAHWTSSLTLTAGAWTLVQPAFDQALYAGYYALIGARVYSATGIFFRMFPAMGPKWRPGGTCVQNYDGYEHPAQRGFNALTSAFGGWGTWLNFYQNVPPQVEIYATGADTASEGWFDMIYLGPQVISSSI